MNRSEAEERARLFYQNRKLEIERDLEERQKRAEKEVPGLKELLNERAALPVQSMRLAMSNPGNSAEIAEKMKARSLELNRVIREKLLLANLGEDFLKPRYECALCRDTGYVGEEIPLKKCECFEKRIKNILAGVSANPMARFTFADFDLNVIPDEPVAEGITQRDLSLDRMATCREYAERYPNTPQPGLILNGQAGLGKSFLLSCIYRRLTEKDADALLISSFEMMECIRRRQFHEGEDDDKFEKLLSTPVLLIDDFGNEPFIRGISAEYICLLLDRRMSVRLHTVLTTNLTPVQLKEKYNERVSSRLTDKSYWEQLSFLGRDLRNV